MAKVLLLIPLLLLILASRVLAQQATADICASSLDSLWTLASDACVGKPLGYVCNGGAAPVVEPVGAVSSALGPVGALVEIGAVDFLRTAPLNPESNHIGIAWLRSNAPLRYTAFMLGDVSMRDVSPPDFPAWTSSVVETSTEPPDCSVAPLSALIVQSSVGEPVRIVINGVSLYLNGTILVRTAPTETTFVGISGQSSVMAFSTEESVWTGQQVSVPRDPAAPERPSAPPNFAVPFDISLLQNLPVALFDRPLILPQPGYVQTQGQVNLRVSPDMYSGLIMEVPPGQVMSVLGRNPEGTWYHVRLESGMSGWMLADLLSQNVGAIQAVYTATPLPPQRYGELGTRARVLAPNGASLREGPEISFPLVSILPDGTSVNLLARSPYSPWVKIEVGGMTGWLALLSIDTRAFIDALPIDANVPLPPPTPTPTQVPGSFGNAFPDPERDHP